MAAKMAAAAINLQRQMKILKQWRKSQQHARAGKRAKSEAAMAEMNGVNGVKWRNRRSENIRHQRAIYENGGVKRKWPKAMAAKASAMA
jgi:hypothetical protein